MNRFFPILICTFAFQPLLFGCGGSSSSQKSSSLLHETDRNHDGNPDVWQRLANEGDKIYIAEKKFDLNFDGKIDIVRVFNAEGELIEDQLDMDFDGFFDVASFYEGGVLQRKELDANFDRKPDIFQYYLNGQISRIERDLNFDGKIDHWEHFDEKGILTRAESDDDGDGVPETEAEPLEWDTIPPESPDETGQNQADSL